jgi:hypothetical protein
MYCGRELVHWSRVLIDYNFIECSAWLFNSSSWVTEHKLSTLESFHQPFSYTVESGCLWSWPVNMSQTSEFIFNLRCMCTFKILWNTVMKMWNNPRKHGSLFWIKYKCFFRNIRAVPSPSGFNIARLDHVDEGCVILWNVRSCCLSNIVTDTAHPRRHESSGSLLGGQ